ncbi:DUF6098 family protein [Amycolatopsis sp. EV170708-02-1]|uniref:DUF6098 family protein n=1 Tax=Amycolatopsis sp. EV170708-02-1 TaxID=2919322 RepID=UPI0037C1094F
MGSGPDNEPLLTDPEPVGRISTALLGEARELLRDRARRNADWVRCAARRSSAGPEAVTHVIRLQARELRLQSRELRLQARGRRQIGPT